MDSLDFAHIGFPAGEIDFFMLPTGDIRIKLLGDMNANIGVELDTKLVGYLIQWLTNNYPTSPNHPAMQGS